jgi:ActR/RegA family two-component response regulator
VDYAPSAQEARIFLEKKTYDYVFLDMKLENGVSGMEVLQHINTAAPSVSVVIMSGSVNLHDLMEQANQVGVLSFIKKPTQFTRQYHGQRVHEARPSAPPGDPPELKIISVPWSSSRDNTLSTCVYPSAILGWDAIFAREPSINT